MVGHGALPPAGQHAVQERRQVTRDRLRSDAVILREDAVPGAVLEIEDSPRRVLADRGAQHRLDRAGPDAVTCLEPLVGERRGRHHRRARREGLGNDAARDGGPHALELLGREAVRDRVARDAGVLVVVELEVAMASLGHLHDQGECVAQKRLDLLLP